MASEDRLRIYQVTIHPQSLPSRQRLKEFLDRQSDIKNWLIWLPNSIFVVTDRGAQGIADLFQDNALRAPVFVVEVAEDYAGWLPEAFWEFINHPKPVENGKRFAASGSLRPTSP